MSAWNRFRARRHVGDHDGGPSTSPRVDRLLDSARAPGTARELAREDEATMRFHRAHLDRVHSTRRESPMSSPSPRAGLKAAIAAAGVVALMSTGAAFAASGHAPWSGAAAGPPTTIPSHTHPTDDPSESATDDTSESADPAESDDTSAPDSTSTTGPDAHAYPGLCRAYAAGQKSEHGAALLSPAFAALVAAAGGPDAVADFCATLASEQALPTQAATPTHPAHPTHPTHPAAPTHPASPTHPAHPTHPAAPSHPKPTHSGSTSHPDGSSHPGPDSHPTRP